MWEINKDTDQRHASVLAPSMVMAHDPQMPSRQDRRNVSVGSISFLILMRASRTIGPQSLRSTSYDCMCGLSPGLSGFCQQYKHPDYYYRYYYLAYTTTATRDVKKKFKNNKKCENV